MEGNVRSWKPMKPGGVIPMTGMWLLMAMDASEVTGEEGDE